MYADRIKNLPPYLFAGIDKAKQEARAKGVAVIDLSVGDPHLPTPDHIVQALKQAANDSSNHQYPSYEGKLAFRNAVADWYKKTFDIDLDPKNEVLTLIGSKEGIAHAPLAFINPGDVALVPDPAYPVYATATAFAGGEPAIMPLLRENGYDEHITVEKSGDYIYLRFREGILFLPDQAVMREGAMPILANISEVILDSYKLISNIDISGHTARIPYDLPSKDNLFSWELSTNRALTVLEYLVRQCDMPQEKLSVTGYSSNLLYVQGNSEEYWAQNRRVEIRLSKAKSQPSAKTAPDKKSTSS